MMSIIISTRSDDAETKCGCVLTDSENTILSTGFNGFVRGADPNVLPNVRPFKYPFFLHSEHNAVLNCARMGKSTLNSIAYVSGQPCVACTQILIQSGCKKIFYTDWSKPKMCESEDTIRNVLKYLNLIEITFVPLKNLIQNFENLFVNIS
jgi:dCMP deaminase